LVAARKPFAQDLAARLQLRLLRRLELEVLFLLMGSSLLDYVVGMMLARTKNPRARRGWLILSLTANLGTIAFFKYYNFFVISAAALLAWLGLPASVHTLNIIIPVGVSFYTFHSMSYTIDVYRGKMRAVPSLLDVACFIGFVHRLNARGVFSRWWRRGSSEIFAAGYGCSVALVLVFIPAKYTPFIYFQF
jgi:D-alanyl-lipoteichoic acid acyltransferase DltB (MBOAT superfamily)